MGWIVWGGSCGVDPVGWIVWGGSCGTLGVLCGRGGALTGMAHVRREAGSGIGEGSEIHRVLQAAPHTSAVMGLVPIRTHAVSEGVVLIRGNTRWSSTRGAPR